MKIAVAASPDVAIPTLEWLRNSKHDLALVISRPDSAVGRGRQLSLSPVSSWAKANGIELYQPSKATDFDQRLADFDLVITIGYGLILPQLLLKQPKFGFINLHFSLLPELRGAAPVQRAIIEGMKETGVTVFQLDAGMDTGPVFIQQKFQIVPGTTSGELLSNLAALGPELIEKTLVAIESGIAPIPQESSKATMAPKLSKAEAQIDWETKSHALVNKILGFSPNPGAVAKFRGEVLRITNAQVGDIDLPKGQVRQADGRVYVGTADGSIELLTVTPAGKRNMSAAAWANGARFGDGESFE